MIPQRIRVLSDETDVSISDAKQWDVVLIVPETGDFGNYHCVLTTKENIIPGVTTPQVLIANGDLQAMKLVQLDFDIDNASLSIEL